MAHITKCRVVKKGGKKYRNPMDLELGIEKLKLDYIPIYLCARVSENIYVKRRREG